MEALPRDRGAVRYGIPLPQQRGRMALVSYVKLNHLLVIQGPAEVSWGEKPLRTIQAVAHCLP